MPTDIPYSVGYALLQWVYTDRIDATADDEFILDLLRAASKFHLAPLSDR